MYFADHYDSIQADILLQKKIMDGVIAGAVKG